MIEDTHNKQVKLTVNMASILKVSIQQHTMTCLIETTVLIHMYAAVVSLGLVLLVAGSVLV